MDSRLHGNDKMFRGNDKMFGGKDKLCFFAIFYLPPDIFL